MCHSIELQVVEREAIARGSHIERKVELRPLRPRGAVAISQVGAARTAISLVPHVKR